MAERLCSNCVHAYLGMQGVFCGMFRDEIINERVARDCPEFEEIRSTPVEVIR